MTQANGIANFRFNCNGRLRRLRMFHRFLIQRREFWTRVEREAGDLVRGLGDHVCVKARQEWRGTAWRGLSGGS